MKRLMTAGVALFLLAGCTTYSEVPRAMNFPTAFQHKALAATHWSLIANDVAEHVKNSVGRNGTMLYVAEPQKKTAFEQAFHNMFISALVNKGLNVAKTTEGSAWTIEVNAQLVKFSPHRFQNSWYENETELAAGLLAVNGIVSRSEMDGVDTLAKSALKDWKDGQIFRQAGGYTPTHELIVTMSATNNLMYTSRRTNVYYIQDSQRNLYGNGNKNIIVTGDK